jgi:hypothetical protein
MPKSFLGLDTNGESPADYLKRIQDGGYTKDDLFRGITSGTLDRKQLEEVVRTFDPAAFGATELGGKILVIEPPKGFVSPNGKPVRVYLILEGDQSLPELNDGDPFFTTSEMTKALPLDLTELVVDPSGDYSTKKKERKPGNNKPDSNIKSGSSSGRRVSLFDPAIHAYIQTNLDSIAHLALVGEELDDSKKPIEGDDLLTTFDEGSSLQAVGVTKVHSIESLVRELAQKRIKTLRKKVRSFYATTEGKDFTRVFLEQDFPEHHNSAPQAIRWVLEHPELAPAGRTASFLLYAVGAGILFGEEDLRKRRKGIYQFWGRVARSVENLRNSKWVLDNNLLGRQLPANDVGVSLLREHLAHPARYSPATYVDTMRGLFGLERLLNQGRGRESPSPIGAFHLNVSFITPGPYIIREQKALREIVDALIEKKPEDITSLAGYLQSRVEEEGLLPAYSSTRKMPKSSAVEPIMQLYLKTEADRLKEHFTGRDKPHYLGIGI